MDIWWHLATEEYLLNRLTPNQRILYLWQSDGAVVVGKNQNPWKECFVPRVVRDGLKLARRISGGGTVYQDSGNLNFTFFADRKSYDLDEQIRIIVSSLEKIGIFLSIETGHKLTINGAKCSGNAFCFRKDSALHHGTLLVNANTDKLKRYLKAPDSRFKTRAVSSKPAKVINLSEIIPGITCRDIINLIMENFIGPLAIKPKITDLSHLLDPNDLERLYQKHKSWVWVFGNTPKFQIHWQNQFPWGDCLLRLFVEEGNIAQARVVSESLTSHCKSLITQVLFGCRFNSSLVANRIRSSTQRRNHNLPLDDIADWIEKKDF